MKITTVAAAAVLLGSVSAQGRDSSTNTVVASSSKPDDKTSATSDSQSQAWSAWTSSSTSAKPTSSSTSSDSSWSEWTSTSSSTSAKTSTSTDPNSTWSDWSATTSSTSAKTSTSITSTSAATVVTITVYNYDDPVTWSEWSTSSAPSTVISKVTNTNTVTVSNTITMTASGSTKTAKASSSASSSTSSSTSSSASSNASSSASSNASSSASSSVSVDTAWSAWPTTAAAVAAPAVSVDGNCKLEISLSYGPPVWFPTPVIADPNTTTVWGVWDSTTSSTPAKITSSSSSSASSSTPAKITSSSSSSASVTWANWVSTTTDPSKKTSTSSSSSSASVTWSVWDSTTPGPSTKTSTSSSSAPASWSAWDSSTTDSSKKTSTSKASVSVSTSSSATGSGGAWTQTQGGAFYTTKSSSSNWSQSSSGISANGNKFGMTYSPYTAGGQCKDASTVAADIAQLAAKGFTSVRVYSTDCSTLENVGTAARANGIKVILGVFISETGISGAQPQVDAIAKWAQWDLVELIVVGNEAVFQGRCSASDLAAFIRSSKATFQAAGFKGMISTTDELSIWQSQGSAWCDVVDVVTANLYAFFNSNTRAEDAGDFISSQIKDLSSVCPGKDVYVMESGWPSAGECNGVACPSTENQATAVKGIMSAVGAKIVFFSFEDEQWKTPGQFGVEQHWGCASVFT